MKELTHNDATKFWDYLEKEYPQINSQLSNHAFVGQTIVSFQPARMSNEDYKEYERILKSWLTENGFI